MSSADVALAVQGVSSDGIQLSAPSRLNMAAMTTAFSGVAGGPIASFALENVAGPVLEAITTAMLEVTSDLKEAAEMVSALGNTAPIMNVALGIVAGVMQLMAADAEREVDLCQDYLDRYRARPSGSSLAEGCVQCPVDLFAVGIAPESWRDNSGRKRLRPAIGQVLIYLTETDPHGKLPDATPGELRYFRSAPIIAGKGVRTARRVLFRKVRKAIEASAPIDKGQAVWPLYLDLLAREFREGNLTGEYIRAALRGAQGWFGPQETPCQAVLANQVVRIYSDWARETMPSSALGRQKIAELEAAARKVAERVVGQAHPRAVARLRLGMRGARRGPSLPLLAAGVAVAAKLAGFW